MNRVRHWNLKLEEFGISNERYTELKYACLQYGQYKASKDERWVDKIKAVEQAAEAADPALAKYILRNVTEKAKFEEMPVPSGVNQFFRARRRFFVELHRLLP